jgi:hypothetical protein
MLGAVVADVAHAKMKEAQKKKDKESKDAKARLEAMACCLQHRAAALGVAPMHTHATVPTMREARLPLAQDKKESKSKDSKSKDSKGELERSAPHLVGAAAADVRRTGRREPTNLSACLPRPVGRRQGQERQG